MPLIMSHADDEMKAGYLKSLFYKVYLSDICERNGIRHEDDLGGLVNILASSIGSLTNPSKLACSFKSGRNSTITGKTIKTYITSSDAAVIRWTSASSTPRRPVHARRGNRRNWG